MQPAASHPQQQQALPPGEAPEEVQAAAALLSSDPEGAAAAGVLARLLGNIVAAPSDAKFRRLRLSNPRIAAVAHANGGIELLLACGFEIQFEEAPGAGGEGGAGEQAEQAQEGLAILPEAADLAPLQHALRLLGPLLPTPPSSAAATAGSSSRSSSLSSASVLPAAQQPAPPGPQQRAQRPPREWEPPRERNTQASSSSWPARRRGWAVSCRETEPGAALPSQRCAIPDALRDAPSSTGTGPPPSRVLPWRPPASQVLLPTSVERDVPDWFFQRTGAELKAAFMSVVRRREQDQVGHRASMPGMACGATLQPTQRTRQGMHAPWPSFCQRMRLHCLPAAR